MWCRCRSAPARWWAWSGRLREGQGGNFKPVTGVIEAPSLSPKMRKFLDWVAWYTLAPKGSALAMGLKLADPDRPEAVRVGVRLAGPPPEAHDAGPAEGARGRRRTALVRLKRELAHAAGVSAGVIDGLVDEGTLETVALLPEPVAEPPDPDFGQHRALRRPARRPRERSSRPCGEEHPPVTLLEGVTGSGKTEVYFEAVAEAVRQGRQALILMPEIALTAQFLDRFAARFGAKPADLAFRRHGPQARAALCGDRIRRGEGGGGRPLGPVPALRAISA